MKPLIQKKETITFPKEAFDPVSPPSAEKKQYPLFIRIQTELLFYNSGKTFNAVSVDEVGDDRIISESEVLTDLQHADILLPKPRHYWIETNYSQYIHAHHAEDLDITREIISEKYPEYIPQYDSSMKKTSGHRFNMFIMKKELLDEYCSWLFSILFELEERLDISSYSDNDARVFGFVSERLLDVWIDANKIDFKEIPYIFMEKENWPLKIYRFLRRKVMGKKS